MIAKRMESAASLVVFSDDWGRHPSSCQHLIRQLLPHYKVLWVNTIGTRAPRFDMATVKRVAEKAWQWISSDQATGDNPPPEQHRNLKVVNPRMWPWFGRRHDRRLNAWLLSQQLSPLIGQLPQPVCAVTTLPITADLPGRLPVTRWVYYCVDDFGEWPGLDGDTLRTMDLDMVRRADEIVAVSTHLQQMIACQKRESRLLTHGVDLDLWQSAQTADSQHMTPGERLLDGLEGPLAVFWGVVDRRLDTDMLIALSERMKEGHIVLVGPQQDPDERVLQLPNLRTLGPQPFEALPGIACQADVLIMPYANLPVTQAMQPLKMKEYMATGKPVVVSRLPAVMEWSDCLDVTFSPREFADTVVRRFSGRIPEDQQQARTRLKQEGWRAKAKLLEMSFVPEPLQSEDDQRPLP
ncbi:MAG: glycosyltransferase [Planctomycetaceae bacterium]